jgi:hypothetical protein
MFTAPPRSLGFQYATGAAAPAQRRHSFTMPYSSEKSLSGRTRLDL